MTARYIGIQLHKIIWGNEKGNKSSNALLSNTLLRLADKEEKYAVFARSFSRRSGEHLCFDLNDIEKIFVR